jgi:hypothetical protein
VFVLTRDVTGLTIASLVQLYADALTATDGVVADLTALPTQWQMVAKMSGCVSSVCDE